MRTVAATRYVTPLREGGSLPAIVEADDEGLYVVKFRGAGQGPKALVAELVAGEIARACGLPVPELVFVGLDPVLARTEPDPEIQDLIRASAGLNIGLDYLPGAVAFDPLAAMPGSALASRIVWFDACVTNLDRTPRNPNLLLWHGGLWLIDHGAALYAQHRGGDFAEHGGDPFPLVADHVLLAAADALDEADRELAARLTPDVLDGVAALIPDAWLDADAPASSARATYRRYLARRLAAPRAFFEEALRARACRA
jgi:hypothetical protein